MSEPKFLSKKPRSSEDVREAIQQDWYELSRRLGIGALEDATGAERRDTVANTIAGKHAPRLHTALNSLIADPAALFNTFQLFGGCFVPVNSDAESDMATISAMLHAATNYLDLMKDGVRCPSDTAALAKLFAPLVPAMLAIIEQANGKPQLARIGRAAAA